MSLDRDNVIQAFGWFKDLMDADIDAKLAGLSYTLPAATEYDLGGVKVGDGLEMDADNRLNVTISGGESNVIEAITVDGTLQPVTNKTAALNMSAYAKKTDVANALSSISSLSLAINSLKVGDTNVINSISIDGVNQPPDANKNVNLSLSGYAKKTEVASGVRMKGSVDFFSDLANMPETPAVGDLYNIQQAGGSDGTGVAIKAGDNVVYTDKGTWDVMAGFVDTSTFVEKVAGKQLSTNDFTNADKAKLDSLSNATPYTLPAATTTTRGGIRPGEGLEMRKDIKSGDDTDILDCTLFVGATATTPGIAGMVPAPGAGQQGEFLCCDGNWTPLPVATSIKSGIVMIGAGLSISSGVLSCTATGGTDDVFEGATSIKGGTSGLVPSPAAGDNTKFLRGDGIWAPAIQNITVVGGDVTVPPNPQTFGGALWEDTLDNGEPCLKMRYGDYEFNFKYDTKNYTGTTPAPVSPEDAQLYMLDTVPSTDEGTLWYNVTQSTYFPIPALCLHAGSFDYGYNYDTITYKGGNTGLVSYLPLQNNISDAMGNATSSQTTPTFESFKIGSTTYRGLKNVDSSSTGSKTTTNKQCIITLKSSLATYTIDFWMTITTTLPGNSSFMLLNYTSGSQTFQYYTSDSHIQVVGGKPHAYGLTPGSRYHVALTKPSGGSGNLFINGVPVTETFGNSSTAPLAKVNLFNNPYGTGLPSPIYIDHLRIWNKIVWDGAFEVPAMSSY